MHLEIHSTSCPVCCCLYSWRSFKWELHWLMVGEMVLFPQLLIHHVIMWPSDLLFHHVFLWHASWAAPCMGNTVVIPTSISDGHTIWSPSIPACNCIRFSERSFVEGEIVLLERKCCQPDGCTFLLSQLHGSLCGLINFNMDFNSHCFCWSLYPSFSGKVVAFALQIRMSRWLSCFFTCRRDYMRGSLISTELW